MKCFKNALAFINGEFIKTDITVNNGVITSIGDSTHCAGSIDCKGRILSAGYIDVHSHGGYSHDIMEAADTAFDSVGKFHLDNGTTAFCPTTLTADIADITSVLSSLRSHKAKYSRLLGAHLEGPYLSPAASGAHPQSLLRVPAKDGYGWINDYSDCIARITIAPDLSGSAELTKYCTERGIQVSLGHDASIDDEILSCIQAGATSVTHLYNCTSRPSRRTTPHKHLGLTEMALIKDELYTEIIADDRHVPNGLFDMIFKLKGADKICLVSDTLSVAGCTSDKELYIGAGESRESVVIEDGVAVIKSKNTYAGSITPLSGMVRKLCAYGIPLRSCLTMTTLSPAKLLGLNDRGDIKIGALADLNILEPDGTLCATYLGGDAAI